ncbi:peptidyl-prolyl cis-trans isomerase [Candidatus Sumerlaeota bacterium]|nr:peptidyl-prolyl cis-trans isomerase [Candidatus Sumerlaeota bacterium]
MKLRLLLCGILMTALLNAPFAAHERVARYPHPYTEHKYDPRGDVELARCNGGAITDLDLYIFLQMTGHKKPHIYDLYMEAKRPKDKVKISKEIQRQLRQYVRFQGMAAEGGLNVDVPGALDLYRRYLTYPIIEWVWLSEILLPQIQIDPADRANYYEQHREDYTTDESVQVRMIFRKAGEDISREKEDEIHSAMQALHQQLTEGGDFAALAREHSESPSAANGGLLPPLEKGRYAFTIEEAIFNLQPGDLTPVFRGPGGFYIMQVVDRFPYRELSVSEAQEDIDEELTPAALSAFHDLRFRQMTRVRDSLTETGRFHQRPMDQTIIWSRAVQVTLRQFLYMFPEIYQSPVKMDRKALNRAVYRLHDGEMITEQVRETPYIADPRITRAKELADTLIRANNAYRSMALQISPSVDEQEAQDFYDDNRDDFSSNEQWRVFLITCAPRDVSGMAPQEFVTRSGEYRQALISLTSGIAPDIANYNQQRAAWEESEGRKRGIMLTSAIDYGTSPVAFLRFQRYAMTAPPFFSDFDRYNTEELAFNAQDLGFIEREASDEKDDDDDSSKELLKRLRDLKDGDFSKVFEHGPGYAVYYVDRHIPQIETPYERARLDVRKAVINKRIKDAIQQKHEAIDAASGLEYIFDPEPRLNDETDE